MTLTYTGQEALNIVHQTFKDDAIMHLHQASFQILRVSIMDQVSEAEALEKLLLQPITRSQGILLLAALHRLCNDKTGQLTSLYKVKIYEYQQKQIGLQLFALERSQSITEKRELRQIFIEQQAILKSKINQLLNAFTVVEPTIIDFRLNCR